MKFDCELFQVLKTLVLGQDAAIANLANYIEVFDAGLAEGGRPAGVFLLLGPTGTGKTKTVEALAEALHGSPKKMVKIDCGEFQMEHEVAKLLGAPPGYLGHRETQPLLSQHKLNDAVSKHSDLAIVLFDEIEKAAPSMARLLLGILDKATLRTGDNAIVNFEKALIFMTSNLGTAEMNAAIRPLGFLDAGADVNRTAIGKKAFRNKYTPEFCNRVDETLTYQPLSREVLRGILEIELDKIRERIYALGDKSFALSLTVAAKEHILDLGTNEKTGARELKRVLHRKVVQELARLVNKGLMAGEMVSVSLDRGELRFDPLFDEKDAA